jgi:hypothetical protein
VCRWKIPDPDTLLDSVLVVKKPDPALWDKVILTELSASGHAHAHWTILLYCIIYG